MPPCCDAVVLLVFGVPKRLSGGFPVCAPNPLNDCAGLPAWPNALVVPPKRDIVKRRREGGKKEGLRLWYMVKEPNECDHNARENNVHQRLWQDRCEAKDRLTYSIAKLL